MSVDLSLLDLSWRQHVKDPQAYLQAAVQWRFSLETGSPYWLERVKALDFDPLTEVKIFEDLARFPNIVGELRNVARDLVPKGYGPNPPTPLVFETSGTTGAPKRAIVLPDWEKQLVAWHVADLLEEPHLRDGGLLS